MIDMKLRYFLDALEKAENGPICEIKDWDLKILPKKISEKLEEYGLKGTYNPKIPVPSDDGLADAFWKAGFDLAVDMGVLCTTTKRIIKFSENELKDYFNGVNTTRNKQKKAEKLQLEGVDFFKPRKIEDDKAPITSLGPMIVLSEDLYVSIIQSFMQYSVIDFVEMGQVDTIYGKERKMGTPSDILGEMRRFNLWNEAAKRAGRIGPWDHEPDHYSLIGELKTNYQQLTFVSRQYRQGKNETALSMSNTIMGGYAGGPEGSVISSIASAIMMRLIYQINFTWNEISDFRYTASSSREAIWANSVKTQAIHRNSEFLTFGSGTCQTAGPCTQMLLYEIAIAAIKDAVNGDSSASGVRPNSGTLINHSTGLEGKFAAEVAKSATGMKREDANEIVKALLSRYEERLSQPPRGKPFQDCFSIKTLKPSKEWDSIYRQTWKDLVDLGIEENIT